MTEQKTCGFPGHEKVKATHIIHFAAKDVMPKPCCSECARWVKDKHKDGHFKGIRIEKL